MFNGKLCRNGVAAADGADSAVRGRGRGRGKGRSLRCVSNRKRGGESCNVSNHAEGRERLSLQGRIAF